MAGVFQPGGLEGELLPRPLPLAEALCDRLRLPLRDLLQHRHVRPAQDQDEQGRLQRVQVVLCVGIDEGDLPGRRGHPQPSLARLRRDEEGLPRLPHVGFKRGGLEVPLGHHLARGNLLARRPHPHVVVSRWAIVLGGDLPVAPHEAGRNGHVVEVQHRTELAREPLSRRHPGRDEEGPLETELVALAIPRLPQCGRVIPLCGQQLQRHHLIGCWVKHPEDLAGAVPRSGRVLIDGLVELALRALEREHLRPAMQDDGPAVEAQHRPILTRLGFLALVAAYLLLVRVLLGPAVLELEPLLQRRDGHDVTRRPHRGERVARVLLRRRLGGPSDPAQRWRGGP